MQHNPSVKKLRKAGWVHYEILKGVIPSHTSSWTGFHANMGLTASVSAFTPSISSDVTTNPPASAYSKISLLEKRLDEVEFHDDYGGSDIQMDTVTPMHSQHPLRVATALPVIQMDTVAPMQHPL